MGLITFRAFAPDRNLCFVTILREYLNVSKKWRPRKEKSLIITTCKPYVVAHKCTIAKWVRSTLRKSGIDINMFKAHSVRGASTSKLFTINVPVDKIMKHAMWSQEGTFKKFYNKEVLPTEDISHRLLTEFIQKKRN